MYIHLHDNPSAKTAKSNGPPKDESEFKMGACQPWGQDGGGGRVVGAGQRGNMSACRCVCVCVTGHVVR